jgi:hypothetical protein
MNRRYRLLQAVFFAGALSAIDGQGLAKDQRTSLVVAGGGTHCDRWIEERAKDASVLGFGLEDWVLGVLIGMKFGDAKTTKLPIETPTWLNNITEDDALARIDNYCRVHRMDYLFQAVLATAADLMDEHADRIKRLVPPAATRKQR